MQLIPLSDAPSKVSLSARRAWIEIFRAVSLNYKEVLSLSARRAWIEIRLSACSVGCVFVALRKESVDRNIVCCIIKL